jgi:hypothetical protein
VGLWGFANCVICGKEIRGVIPQEYKKLKDKETELKGLL